MPKASPFFLEKREHLDKILYMETKKSKRKTPPSFWLYEDSKGNIYSDLIYTVTPPSLPMVEDDNNLSLLKLELERRDPREFVFDAVMEVVDCRISSVSKSYMFLRDISKNRKFFLVHSKYERNKIPIPFYKSVFFTLGASEINKIILDGHLDRRTISGEWKITKRGGTYTYKLVLVKPKEIPLEEEERSENQDG